MAVRQLSLWEKVDIPIALTQALIETIFALFTRPFRGSNIPESIDRDLRLTITRNVLTRLSPEQLQSIAGSTETNYLAYTKSLNIPAQIFTLPNDNTRAFWFGDSASENVVIYYHGGGWAMPGDGHFKLVRPLVTKAEMAGKSLAVLFLQYDLAPSAHYPRQLTQAIELLRYTINNLGKSPGNIMLMGDSSGANMILGVLSHLMHPHPSIKPLEILTPLRGAMMSSPVVILNTERERYRTHVGQDPASYITIGTWLKNYLGPNQPDSWNQPLTNKPTWWSDLPKAVKEALITVASKEMMADDIRACAANIKSVYKDLTLFVSEADFHAEPAIGPSLGMSEGEAAQMMHSWAIERY